MRFLETPKDRAGLLILALGVAILIALTPFLSGLLGAAVLYVMFVGVCGTGTPCGTWAE